MKRNFLSLVLSTIYLLSSSTFADSEKIDLEALRERVDKLEKRLLLDDHNSGNVSTFGAEHLNIGGYFNLTGTSWNLMMDPKI